MSIYQYPDYLMFIKNELKTLQFLAYQPYIIKNFGELSKSAENTFYNLQGNDRELRTREFIFGCNFDIVVERERRRIVIEAHLTPRFNIVSYVLSICRNSVHPYCLIRKFHFDYALPKNDEDPKPVYHLQYGGELSPQLENLQLSVEELHPWLSTPRISFYPINLALLIDMIFTEFRSDETYRIAERSEWRDFIKSNEDTILKPFYEKVNHFLNAAHSSDYLLRDFYYGKVN